MRALYKHVPSNTVVQRLGSGFGKTKIQVVDTLDEDSDIPIGLKGYVNELELRRFDEMKHLKKGDKLYSKEGGLIIAFNEYNNSSKTGFSALVVGFTDNANEALKECFETGEFVKYFKADGFIKADRVRGFRSTKYVLYNEGTYIVHGDGKVDSIAITTKLPQTGQLVSIYVNSEGTDFLENMNFSTFKYEPLDV